MSVTILTQLVKISAIEILRLFLFVHNTVFYFDQFIVLKDMLTA